MKEAEVISAVAKELNVYYSEAEKTVATILGCIKDELVNGGEVKLVDFGIFKVKDRAPKKGFQPYYRKEIIIPACKEPVFVPGKLLKEIINKD